MVHSRSTIKSSTSMRTWSLSMLDRYCSDLSTYIITISCIETSRLRIYCWEITGCANLQISEARKRSSRQTRLTSRLSAAHPIGWLQRSLKALVTLASPIYGPSDAQFSRWSRDSLLGRTRQKWTHRFTSWTRLPSRRDRLIIHRGCRLRWRISWTAALW